jgi:integrase
MTVDVLKLPVNHRNGPWSRTVFDHEVMNPFTGYAAWLRVNDCSTSTIQDRLRVLADFDRTHPDFPHVTPGQVIDWVGRPGYAQWTRGAYYGHLHSFFAYAAATGLVAVNPMTGLKRPKSGKSIPRPLTVAQVSTVMAAARPTVRAWLTLGLFAGLRAFEVAKLRGEDIDRDDLFVCGKGGKNSILPTHPLVWELAQTMPRYGWWFPTCSTAGHVTSMYLSTTTTNLFKANGIEGSIHRTRHTFATQLLRAGCSIRIVQELMRHSSLSSTQVYLAVDDDERRDAINRLVAA